MEARKIKSSRSLVVLNLKNGQKLAVKPRSITSINESKDGDVIIATDTGGVFRVAEDFEYLLKVFELEPNDGDEESN